MHLNGFSYFCFFFIDPATTVIYTLSLHDALPISQLLRQPGGAAGAVVPLARHTGKPRGVAPHRSEEHTSELQSHSDLVCRLLLEKKKIRSMQILAVRGKYRPGRAPGTPTLYDRLT